MSKPAKFKLYLWEGVLCDYTCGVAFAIATNIKDARKIAAKSYVLSDYCFQELKAVKPKIKPIDKPFGFTLSGGG